MLINCANVGSGLRQGDFAVRDNSKSYQFFFRDKFVQQTGRLRHGEPLQSRLAELSQHPAFVTKH